MECKVNCPRFNANDDTYFIQEIVESGTFVEKESILIHLETSKAIVDIAADEDGFFFHSLELDDEVEVGQLLGVISEDKNFSLSSDEITNLVEEDNPVTNRNEAEDFSTLLGVERIAVIGGGRGFDQIMDLVSQLSDKVVSCVYDDVLFNEESRITKSGVPVSGKISGDSIIADYHRNKFDSVIISISSNLAARNIIFTQLDESIPFSTLVHPNSYVSRSASIGRGSVIFQFSSVSAYAVIGNNCFLSAYTNVEHHCQLGSSLTTGPGVFFSGSVLVGDRVKFGSSISVEPNIKIADDSIIGSNILINFDVEAPSIIVNNQSVDRKINKWVKQ